MKKGLLTANDKYRHVKGNTTLDKYETEQVQEGVKQIEKVQLLIGILMREIPKLRLHQNREHLITLVKQQMATASMESITRAQRKLWETALEQLQQGNARYAAQYLPDNEKDFIEWCKTRRIGQETYIKYAREMW